MEEDKDTRKWEDLPNDVLVKIFQGLDIFELFSCLPKKICRSWRFAACDRLLWKTLDLSVFKSDYIKTTLAPYVYVFERSDEQLTKLLKISLNLSRECVTTLIFHFYGYVTDAQLTYTAERTQNLKRLVLPAWNRIKKTGIIKSIRMWKDLQSLAMPTIAHPHYVFEEISKNCNKFSELKIFGPCNIAFVNKLIRFVPNLKVLSLRCSMLHMDALLLILNGLKNLKVLNISHCYIVEGPFDSRRAVEKLDDTVMEKGSRLCNIITCKDDDSCTMCQKTKEDEGFERWYKYEEGLWKEDEVKSLAVF